MFCFFHSHCTWPTRKNVTNRNEYHTFCNQRFFFFNAVPDDIPYKNWPEMSFSFKRLVCFDVEAHSRACVFTVMHTHCWEISQRPKARFPFSKAAVGKKKEKSNPRLMSFSQNTSHGALILCTKFSDKLLHAILKMLEMFPLCVLPWKPYS